LLQRCYCPIGSRRYDRHTDDWLAERVADRLSLDAKPGAKTRRGELRITDFDSLGGEERQFNAENAKA